MYIWDFLKNNSENTELIRNLIFIVFTILNFALGVINFYRSRPKRDILAVEFSGGEYHQFQRNRISKVHIKVDFDVSAINNDIYIKRIYVSKPKNPFNSFLPSTKKQELGNIKKLRYYLSGWPSCAPPTDGWEYDVRLTSKIPINKLLVNHQMQYRQLVGDRNNHDNFRYAWGLLEPDDWTNLDASLQLLENSSKHFTILFELVLSDNDSKKEAYTIFPINKPVKIEICIEYNKTLVAKQVSLEPFIT